LPQLSEWFPHDEKPIFMQDGAPCHKGRMVTKYLEGKNIDILDWPGNLPDMNPIENI